MSDTDAGSTRVSDTDPGSTRASAIDRIERLDSEVVYRNPWMTVRQDAIRRPDGSTGLYGVVDKRDFALVIPCEDDGFHLVEQYRYPVGGRYWEFPQGGWPADGDGDAAALARAELAEETGLRAGRLVHLGRLFNAYGYSSQSFDVFLATDLVAGEASREAEEQDMRQGWVSRREFERMVRAGAVPDANSVAAYALLQLFESSR